MVLEDFAGVYERPSLGRMRGAQVAGMCATAACLAALVVTGSQRPAVRMSDQGLTASTIGMDHNAMLADNSQRNAAFLQTFGSFERSQTPTLATGTTQLAQSPQTPAVTTKKSATSRLNAKLAAQMQASLTAGTQGDSLMTPHFVAALEQATGSSRNQMLSQQQQKATMDALTMTKSSTHILPANLRQKFAITSTKNTLGSFNNLTPQQAAMRVAPMQGTQSLSATGGNPGSASRADSSFLSAEPPVQLTAKQLIQQAALKQMNSMPAPAVPAAVTKPAPVQQLAQYPAQTMQYRAVPKYAPMQMAYQQPQQPQQMAYQQQPQQYYYKQQQHYAPQQQYAQTQMAYQVPPQQAYNGYYQPAAQPSIYPAQQAATQQMYQMAAPSPYQAPAQTMAQPAPQPYTQLAMPQPQANTMVDSSNVGLQTPAEIGAAAANKAAAGNWRAPDLSITAKGSTSKASAAVRNRCVWLWLWPWP